MGGVLAILYRDMLVFWRGLAGDLATTLAMPLTYIFIFGLGLSGFIGTVEGVPYLTFMVPGLVSMAAVLSAFDDSAWGLWFHRRVQGTINEYRVNPITTFDIIFAKILSGFIKAVVKGAMVASVLMAWAGFYPELAHLPLYAAFLLAGSIMFTCLGTIVGTMMDEPEQLGRFEAVLVYPLVFLSGVFFPISVYPEVAIPVINLLPSVALFEGARQALLSGEIVIQFVVALLVGTGLSFWAAVRVFDYRLSE